MCKCYLAVFMYLHFAVSSQNSVSLSEFLSLLIPARQLYTPLVQHILWSVLRLHTHTYTHAHTHTHTHTYTHTDLTFMCFVLKNIYHRFSSCIYHENAVRMSWFRLMDRLTGAAPTPWVSKRPLPSFLGSTSWCKCLK